MAAAAPTTVIVPVPLGAASKYEENIFPRAYHQTGDAITKGSVLLSATLDEIIQIAEMGVDLNTDEQFYFNARVQYEALTAKETKLQARSKSFNPFTLFRHYRAARLFLAASKALFLDTKRTSERIQRREKLMRVVPSTELQAMNYAVPEGATIDGIAVTLPGPLDDNAQQKILAATNAIASRASASNPFTDNPRVSQLSDDDSIITLADTASLLSVDAHNRDSREAEPTNHSSPTSSYQFYFYNSVLTTGSSIQGMTLSHGSGTEG